MSVLIVAEVFAVLAAVLHVVFFAFESVLWTRPAIFGRFGIRSQADADLIRPMAYNQGFYNLAGAVTAPPPSSSSPRPFSSSSSPLFPEDRSS